MSIQSSTPRVSPQYPQFTGIRLLFRSAGRVWSPWYDRLDDVPPECWHSHDLEAVEITEVMTRADALSLLADRHNDRTTTPTGSRLT